MNGYNETKLRNYIEKCSRDASASENREYDKNDCRCEWIIINYENKGYQFYPIFKFRYGRVLGRVIYRLSRNLEKNFGIHYGDLDGSNSLLYDDDDTIDPNFTRFMMKVFGDTYSFSYMNDWTSKLTGTNMISWLYEKLVTTYYGLSIEEYGDLTDGDKRKHLPSHFRYSWEEYKELFEKATGKPVDYGFEICISKGVELL